jgi:uncharacterized protein with HEPN domain
MRPESLKHLYDAQQAALRVSRFSAGRTRQDYESDDYFRAAVERQFEIIGEALNRLLKIDPDTAARISEHRRIIGFRNVLIHGYDAVDHAITWRIIEEKLPILLSELDVLLAADQQTGGPQATAGPGDRSGNGGDSEEPASEQDA